MTKFFSTFSSEQEYKLPAKLKRALIGTLSEEPELVMMEPVNIGLPSRGHHPSHGRLYFCPVERIRLFSPNRVALHNVPPSTPRICWAVDRIPLGTDLKLWGKIWIAPDPKLGGTLRTYLEVIGFSSKTGELLCGRDTLEGEVAGVMNAAELSATEALMASVV